LPHSESSTRSSGVEAVPRLVLDTSAYSHFRHGHETVLLLLAATELVLVPVTVLGELEAAFELGSRAKQNRVLLREFLEEPFVSTIEVTRSVARHYGRVFAELRRAGTPIPVNDIWIAAATLDSGGHLLTFDADYRAIRSLDCTILSP
jgi:predicted nucleic acid-binding protein